MNSDSEIGVREDRLDRAIDRAVRHMMQIDPPPGLRRRVLSRLNQPEQPGWLLPRYLLAAGALAVVVVSTMLLQRGVEPPAPPPAAPHLAVARGVPPVPPPLIDAAENVSHGGGIRSPVRPRFTRERIPMPRVSNVFGTPGPGVSATIDRGGAPVTSGAIDIGAIAPLRIVPLSARPIQIPPLVVDPRAMRR